MRNVTITIPEDVAKWARVWAAENDTSVSAMLSKLLQEMMENEQRYVSALNTFLLSKPAVLSDGEGIAYPSRSNLYDR